VSEPAVRSEGLRPEVRELLEWSDAQGLAPVQEMEIGEARLVRNAQMVRMSGPAEPLPRVEELQIPGARGIVTARLYAKEVWDKAESGVRGALVYFHGGGWVVGDLETHDAICRALAKQFGGVVIAVDYALSPEERFPSALDDAFAVTRWVAKNAEDLGVDAERLAVGGDSAGGNLAAVVAMRCRDAGGPSLAAQVLVYPVTNLSSFDTASYTEFREGYWLSREGMQWFASQYLESAEDGLHPDASPLLAMDLKGLPPALVITAEFDPLRDEGEAYAERLRQAGVPVVMSRYAGLVHGFLCMRGMLPAGQEAIDEVAAFLRSMGD
jgi:acetyl esterase